MRIGKDIFTTGQVAKICGVAPRTVAQNWFDTGRLKGYRIPGCMDRRIPRESLIRFMKENGMPLGQLEEGQWYKILFLGATEEIVGRAGLLLIENEGYRFCLARNWFEAGVEVNSPTPASAIVFDMSLGRAESIEVSLRLRKRGEFEDALFVALANEDDADPDILKSFGFNAVFQKPFDVALLAERIVASRKVDA
jgi:two-component system, OmpR family, response regulator RpaA